MKSKFRLHWCIIAKKTNERIPFQVSENTDRWYLPLSTSLLFQPSHPPAPIANEGIIDIAKTLLNELIGCATHILLYIAGKVQAVCRNPQLVREVAKLGKRRKPRSIRSRQSDRRSGNGMRYWQKVDESQECRSVSPLGFRQAMGLLRRNKRTIRTETNSLTNSRGPNSYDHNGKNDSTFCIIPVI